MVSLLRRLLLIYTLGLAVLIAGIAWVLSTAEAGCQEQWEAVRLPKEMEDLMQKDTRTLTVEEAEETYRAVIEARVHAYEVIHANKELFSRQPNFFMATPSSVGRDGVRRIGVNVHVTEIVPQWKLPPRDRIPCVIDGIPVEITTNDPREFLGGANIKHRPLMAGESPDFS